MTTCVTITTQTQLTDVTSPRDVSTLQSTVMTTTHAPLMFVWTESASTFMHARTLTSAPSLLVMQWEDVKTLQETVMTTMFAPRTAVIQPLDASTHWSLAMIMIHALLILVAQQEDALTNQWSVTTTMHVPRTLVSMESVFTLQSTATTTMSALKTVVMHKLDADSLQGSSETQTNAPSELVMQWEESLTLQETVKMETSAQWTTVMQREDANPSTSLFQRTVTQRASDVTETNFVWACCQDVVSKSHSDCVLPRTNTSVMQELEHWDKSQDAELLVMMVTHVLWTLVMHKPTSVSSLELFAKITMFAPSTSVSMESVTSLKRETVMTMIHAPLTVAIQSWDANTNKSLALITMHVPSTDVQRRREDVFTSTSHAMTAIHVPLILVMWEPDNVCSLQSLAMTTTHAPSILVMSTLETASTDKRTAMTTMHVLLIDAVQKLDAHTLKSTVMTTTHAPKTAVTWRRDVYLHQSTAMTTTAAPKIAAVQRRDVSTLKSLVMTRMFVPMTAATQSLDVSSSKEKSQQEINAESQDVTEDLEWSLRRLSVMTRIHVPSILATLQLDVFTAKSFAMITTHVLLTGVTDKPERSNTDQSAVMTTIHVPQIAVTQQLDVSTSQLFWTVTTTTSVLLMDAMLSWSLAGTNQWAVMMEIHVLLIAAILLKDAETFQSPKNKWMTTTHVPRTSVFQTEESFMNQSNVITETSASSPSAIQQRDVSSMESTVTTTIHAPTTNVLKESASTLLLFANVTASVMSPSVTDHLESV